MRFWIGVGSAFGAGALIGIAVGTLLVEDKLKKEYAESERSMKRAYEAALINAQTPVDLGDGVIHVVRHDAEGTRLEGGPIVEKAVDEPLPVAPTILGAPAENAYWDPATVAGPPTLVSFAELEEEDYNDQDGREKQQITMIFQDGIPLFFQDGKEIDNAFDLVGGTIVDDMRKSVGEGTPFLWIRNNQTEIDYEVVFEQP